ncbi:MAG: 2-(1,2-epoxy-1,2-dihydrophenyl)acetyl-CoA isomerase, partial [Pseudomonadota bacterium]|nr:2-(1,2-epoxy-1,2-dihydrophenyl)acetyl-CoA isomerase [Pseudomonadota bacterium]
TGEPLSAEKAESWGLIWKCVDDAVLMDEAGGLAARFAAGPTLGLSATKHAIRASLLKTLDEELDNERNLMRRLGKSADYREGVNAFLEKRKPTFKGH